MFETIISASWEHILIPFLFVLAIVYGSIARAHIFDKKVNAVISLSLALFAITNQSFVNFLWANMIIVSIFFIAMFFIIFILKVFGTGKLTVEDGLLILGVILFVMFSLNFSMAQSLNFPLVGDWQNAFILVAVVIMLAMFWFAYKTGVGDRTKPPRTQ
jgi:hypothetical protein